MTNFEKLTSSKAEMIRFFADCVSCDLCPIIEKCMEESKTCEEQIAEWLDSDHWIPKRSGIDWQ